MCQILSAGVNHEAVRFDLAADTWREERTLLQCRWASWVAFIKSGDYWLVQLKVHLGMIGIIWNDDKNKWYYYIDWPWEDLSEWVCYPVVLGNWQGIRQFMVYVGFEELDVLKVEWLIIMFSAQVALSEVYHRYTGHRWSWRLIMKRASNPVQLLTMLLHVVNSIDHP